MTSKQKVLKRYPLACILRYPNKVQVRADHIDWECIGTGKTARSAWADAAKRLRP